MIAYLEPAQFLGTLLIGFGLGLMAARAYDAVQHKLAMRRIGRNVKAYAADWPPLPTHLTHTSGPETAPANRDPQEPAATTAPGVAVPVTGVQSADAGEGVAPPARSLTFTELANWRVDHGDDWDEYDFTAADRRKP